MWENSHMNNCVMILSLSESVPIPDTLRQFLLSVIVPLGRDFFSAKFQQQNEYLFTVTGVEKMKWFSSLTRCHFQPRVTEGHEWLEMAPSEK